MTDLDAFVDGLPTSLSGASDAADLRVRGARGAASFDTVAELGFGVRVACRLIPAILTTTGTAAQETCP